MAAQPRIDDLGASRVQDPPVGVSVRELLDRGIVRATVAAGAAGLDRIVARVNVMEVPDIIDFVKPAELLVTTAYPLRERRDDLAHLVGSLDDAGLAGLGIKLGRYLDAMPDEVVASAEERDFPVLLLAPDCSFDEILNDVLSHVLSDQTARLRSSERIHDTFLQLAVQGGGLDAITQELSDLVDAPSAIVSLGGELLAGSRLGSIAGLDIPIPGDALRDSALELLVDTNQIRIGDQHAPVHLAPAAAGPRLFGHVVIIPDVRDVADEHVGETHSARRMALESAATVAALSMTMQAEIDAIEAKYQSDLMHDLLTGRVASTPDALRRARAFGWDLARSMVTVVLRDDSEAIVGNELTTRTSPMRTSFATLVRDRDPRATVVRFGEEIVVLTAPFEEPGARQRARDWLSARLREAGPAGDLVVNVGLSRPVATIEDVPRAYEQAVTALQVGRRVHGPGAVTHFDDLGAHRILALIEDVDELRAFATEVLGELARDDDATADLRQTLRVLLETNLNVAASARRLHFHYNTLRYRIDKLRTLVGDFMEDADVRLKVQLALLIHDMRGL